MRLFAAISMSVVLCCSASAFAQQGLEDKLAALTPPDGWTKSAKVEKYTPDNVFVLIDGEAELYFPYGLKQTFSFTLDRAKPDGGKESVTVELYEMGSLLDAFGIYSNYRDRDAQFLDIGAEACQGSSQIVFYQGAYFARIHATSGSPECGKALQATATALAGALPGGKDKPGELNSLGIEGLIPHSEQYVAQSVLGHSCLAKGMTADAKMGDAEVRIFQVFANSPEEAMKSLKAYEAVISKKGVVPEWKDKVMVGKDPLHKGVVASVVGSKVVGVCKLKDTAAGIGVLVKLAEMAGKF